MEDMPTPKANIAILYICIGEYKVFWENFYKSFEEKFLPYTYKQYFVFTDAKEIKFQENKNVVKVLTDKLVWPYPTLLRWHMFLEIKEQLKIFDYIFFVNANAICNQIISEKEILPDRHQELVFANHPAYYNVQPTKFEYERNVNSSAYIPYNMGKVYVQGCLFGGRTESFLNMCIFCKRNTDIDIKNNIIAIWHDESHLNKYILTKKEYKLLTPEYVYPESFSNKESFKKFKKKIIMIDKSKVIDLLKIKGDIY